MGCKWRYTWRRCFHEQLVCNSASTAPTQLSKRKTLELASYRSKFFVIQVKEIQLVDTKNVLYPHWEEKKKLEMKENLEHYLAWTWYAMLLQMQFFLLYTKSNSHSHLDHYLIKIAYVKTLRKINRNVRH